MGDVTHYVGDQCPGGHYEETTVSDRDYLYGHVCAHGSLARSCEVCDLEAEVRRLREDLQLAQRCIEVVRGAVEIRDRRIPEYQSRRDKAAAVLFGYDEIMRRRRGEPSMLPGTETVTEGHDDD